MSSLDPPATAGGSERTGMRGLRSAKTGSIPDGRGWVGYEARSLLPVVLGRARQRPIPRLGLAQADHLDYRCLAPSENPIKPAPFAAVRHSVVVKDCVLTAVDAVPFQRTEVKVVVNVKVLPAAVGRVNRLPTGNAKS